jgi:hypothetical protein
MYLKDCFLKYRLLLSFINWKSQNILQKNINWYCNNYVEYKIINDYDFLINEKKKSKFQQP